MNLKKTKSCRITALLLVLLLALVSFSGCGGGDSGDSGSAVDPTKLTYALSAEPNSLDPMAIAMMSTFTVTYAIYDNLVEEAPDGSYVPCLAEDIIISEDGLTYTFPIKAGVKFHDGSELTAEDVKFSIERTIEKGWAADMTAAIDTVSVDGSSVVLKLKKPFGGMVGSLASPFFAIMSKSYLETKGDDAAKREPMGTGAYKFKEWVSGDHITLEANEEYFQGAPKIKTVVFKPITDKNTGLIALQKKEADVFLNVNASDIQKVKDDETLAFYSTDYAAVLSLNTNIEAKPLDDVRVRQAIGYAINKENIINGALEGYGTPANSIIPRSCDGYSADVKTYEYDPEKAKALLKEAGLDSLQLKMKVKEDAKVQKVAQIIQADLKNVNIEMEIEIMEGGAYTTDIYANGDYQLSLGAWSAMFLDAYSLAYSQFHKDCYGPTGNITHVVDENLSNLLDDAATKTGDEKTAAYNAVCNNIIENAYTCPLVYEETTITTNALLKGVAANSLGVYKIKNFYWE